MPLSPFASVDRSTLSWIRTAEEPMSFVLASGESRLAEIRWAHRGQPLGAVETADATWSVKRERFPAPHLLLHAADGPVEVARVAPHLNHHRIEIHGGKAYRFHRAGMMVPAWKITTDDGAEIAHIEPVREGRKLEAGAVLVTPIGVDLPELPILLTASWYFIGLAWFEDESLVPFEGSDAPAGPGGPTTTTGGGSPGP